MQKINRDYSTTYILLLATIDQSKLVYSRNVIDFRFQHIL